MLPKTMLSALAAHVNGNYLTVVVIGTVVVELNMVLLSNVKVLMPMLVVIIMLNRAEL